MKKILTISLLFLSLGLFAQSEKTDKKDAKGVEVTHAQFLGKTPPLRDLVPLPGTSPERRKMGKDRTRTIPNFIGRRGSTNEILEGSLPKGVDPVRQDNLNRNASVPLEPLVNIDGMDQTVSNVQPPVPCGEIGGDYFIQIMNGTFFRIFDKEGNSIAGPISTNTLWSGLGVNPAGDPIILYDQEVDRWIITEFIFGNALLFAISETSDPMGSWMAYPFSTPSFPDYPKYSIWSNAYCLTTNEGGFNQTTTYFINREEMLNGEPNPTIQRLVLPGVTGANINFYVGTPVDWTGLTLPPVDAKPMILQIADDNWGGESTDGITIYEVDVDFEDADNTTWEEAFVPTAPFNTEGCAAAGAGFACIPQLNGGGFDGIPYLLMHQIHYRNFETHESMVMNFLVNADGTPIRAGIRWIEMRRPIGGEWSVYQEGTYAPDDGLHRFMGGIAMDGSGNIGLGFSISSPDIYPGLGFTGRKASDPLGEMTIDEYVIVEGESASGTRYGDYAQMTVDPVNDQTFWYTGQYRQPNRWGTRIFSFEISRDTNDIAVTDLLAPISSIDLTNAEPVQIRVQNFGLETQSDFSVGYIFENGTPFIESVNYTLEPDSVYVHTFISTVDMSVPGDYDFVIFNSLSNDDNLENDTLRLVRSKIPRWDASITDVSGFNPLFCGTEFPIFILLTNLGTEPLTGATITIDLNGDLFQTIEWTGTLATNESEEVDLVLSGFINGVNEITATVSDPSGMVDEVAENNSLTRPFDVLTDGVGVSLLLNTDDYPDETTWEVEDENGNVLFAGGPYGEEQTLYTEEWCLDPEGCYEFTIFDSVGDGICCGFGLGSYAIVDGDGNSLASSIGEFGFSETLDFCATFVCMMTADVDISPASAAGSTDGTIMIFQQNGVGPFMYSIDGGLNFQVSNVFDNLPAGEYIVVVTGDSECLYEEVVSIPACTLSFTVETTPETESNSEDGTIIITANDGIGDFSYSINGGTPQSSPIFNGLGTGEYTVVVEDEAGCSTSTVVTVDIETSSIDKFVSQLVEVYPNPTTGVFRVKISGLERTSPLLPLIIYDANGKLVHSIKIGRYDGVYTGQVSLVTQPSGVYFVRFMDEDTDRLVKVIKE